MKNIYRLLIFTSLILPQLSIAQTTIKLFNQKNLDGWHTYQKKSEKNYDASNFFHIDRNMIRFYGNNLGYLISEQSYKNFQLTVEFRWNTDTTFDKRSHKKNSGIIYMVPSNTPDTIWPKGIQFQIKEGATGDFILLKNMTLQINGERTTPGKSVIAERFIDAENPIGEWNTIVITAINGNIKQELNDNIVNQGLEPSVLEGNVLLQYEGYPIDFRKVEIVKL